MEGIGTYLKRQREMRKIRLEDVAQFTKIQLSTLKALELDDTQQLPSPVFIRGFVCSYAKAIGLDVDEALLQLQELGKQNLKGREKEISIKPPTHKIKPWVFLVFILFALIMAAYLTSR